MSLLKLNVVCSLEGIKLRVQRINEQKDLIERWLSRLESHPKPIPECNIMRIFLGEIYLSQTEIGHKVWPRE